MHELPKLPYAVGALEPHIDAKTMEIHHGKHHQAYVDKLNAALKGTGLEDEPLHKLVMGLDKVPENVRSAVRNNGGGHINHGMFWHSMAPNAGGEPSGKLGDAIKETFGSFEKFQGEFENAGITRFGSGWAWLVVAGGKLKVISTPNQDHPFMDGSGVPILGVDVWEHAYYLKYQNKRPDYLKAWWNIVNWKQVEEWYEKAQQMEQK